MKKKVKKAEPKGWKCKNCGSVWSKDVKNCPNCGQKK